MTIVFGGLVLIIKASIWQAKRQESNFEAIVFVSFKCQLGGVFEKLMTLPNTFPFHIVQLIKHSVEGHLVESVFYRKRKT